MIMLTQAEGNSFREVLAERDEEQKKKLKKAQKKREQKAMKRGVNRFAKANNLISPYESESESDSDSSSSSSSSDSESEEEKKKKKKKKKNKKSKDRKKRKKQEMQDKVTELEAKVKEFAKPEPTQKEPAPNSEAIKANIDEIRTAIKEAVSTQLGHEPKASTLPTFKGKAKVVMFASKEQMKSALREMAQQTISLSQGNAPTEASCIMYGSAEMRDIMAEGNETDGTPPASAQSSKLRSRRPAKQLKAITGLKDMQLFSKSEARIGPRTTSSDDDEAKDLGCTVYEYALTGNCKSVLKALKDDATARMQMEKISNKHFARCFKNAVHHQSQTLYKKPLGRSKKDLLDLVKELKLNVSAPEKMSAPELITSILCSIRACPTSQ
jgi:hypothetical protein